MVPNTTLLDYNISEEYALDSLHILFSSNLLSKNMKVYGTIVLPVVLYIVKLGLSH